MTKSYVSMENFICPICGKQHDDGAGILMDTRLQDSFETTTVVGYKFCEEHQLMIAEGKSIFLMESTENNFNGLTGRTLQIKAEAIGNLINDPEMLESTLKHGFALIDPNIYKYMTE